MVRASLCKLPEEFRVKTERDMQVGQNCIKMFLVKVVRVHRRRREFVDFFRSNFRFFLVTDVHDSFDLDS